MNTLVGIQRRFTEIGRIRMGEKREGRNGKAFPAKLDTFRLTSGSLDAIKAVAERYGGTVERWEDEYQVVTDTNSLDVMLPPMHGSVGAYSLSYELWSGGGCQRRCDGEREWITDAPCLCDPEARDCKPTLRVSFFLPDILGFGLWRLETKGYNAAAEMPGMLDLLAGMSAANRPIRAVLRMEQRTSIKGGQTRHYAVPVIDLPYSVAQLTGGDVPVIEQQPDRPMLTSSSEPIIGEEPEIPIHQPEQGVARTPASASQPSGVPSTDGEPVPEESAGPPTSVDAPPAPGLTSEQVAQRYAYAQSRGWTEEQVDDAAAESTGALVATMPVEQWQVFARTVVKDGPTTPPDAPQATEPPKPGTDEYRALTAIDKAAARAYHSKPPEQATLAEQMGAPAA